MKHNKIYTKLLLFLNTCLCLFWHSKNLTMYNITSLQQTQVHANPAFTPTAKINIAIAPLFPPFPIPSAYINISNSGFKLSDLVKQDSEGMGNG